MVNYDPSTPQQKEAVALLMRDCGYALKMQYSENVSSSTGYSALYALKNNFQYDAVLLSKFDEGIGSFVSNYQKRANQMASTLYRRNARRW